MHRSRSLPLFATALSLVLLPASALAQPRCFPPASGVPGLSGAPTSISDPRWQGAFATVPTGGAPAPGPGLPAAYSADPYEFRALTYSKGSQKYLVLTWRTDADPGAQTAGDPDVLYAYLGTGEGTPASPFAGNLITIKRLATKCAKGCSVRCGALAAGISYYNSATSAYHGHSSQPHLWIEPPYHGDLQIRPGHDRLQHRRGWPVDDQELLLA